MFIITDGFNIKSYDDENEALENALNWSIELQGMVISILLNGIHITNIWA